MCLGVPARIVSVGDDVLRTGRVDFGGVSREVSLAYVPEAGIGDYVIVHVGFAIARIDEEEARAIVALLGEMESRAILDGMLETETVSSVAE